MPNGDGAGRGITIGLGAGGVAAMVVDMRAPVADSNDHQDVNLAAAYMKEAVDMSEAGMVEVEDMVEVAVEDMAAAEVAVDMAAAEVAEDMAVAVVAAEDITKAQI